MQQSFSQIIQAAQQALCEFPQTQELLEYPEVQADKAYYLSVLEKYNKLQRLDSKLQQLQTCLTQQDELLAAMSTLTDEEKALAIDELAALKTSALTLSDVIADMLSCASVCGSVFCRILNSGAPQIAETLFELIRRDLTAHGATLSGVQQLAKKGEICEISFTATGAGALSRLAVLSGVHKVANSTAEIALAVTPAQSVVTLAEKDVKIDLFHSGGAGGQNVNKVETAVRATHLPTGTVVVCQDERSQLANKRRALQNLQKRLAEQNAQLEKARMDANVKGQLRRTSTLSFGESGQFIDKTHGQQFAPTPEQFSTYINTILAKNG